MQTRFFSVLIACFIVTSVFSQANLNDYKYVIVSKKYDFLKEVDQYQINSLSKFLFNKYGFQALMEGENYPEDLIQNRCLALKSNMIKGSGMFKTKLSLELTDCQDQVVYTSAAGESREKEYKKAYTEATRNAFKYLELLNYKYEPNESVVAVSTPTSSASNEVAEEIQKLKEEIQTLKKEQKDELAEVKKTTAVVPVIEPESKTQEVKEAAVISQKPVAKKNVVEMSSNILYAQVTENGFQLVDNTPKVIYRISETGADNVYLVESESAIVYMQGNEWIYETVMDGSIKQKKLNIKF